jgi:hypothetical protein
MANLGDQQTTTSLDTRVGTHYSGSDDVNVTKKKNHSRWQNKKIHIKL